MMRPLKDYAILTLKGLAMGAADVVPGVSGGTIAFISGIYEELLETISSVNFAALKKLKSEGIKPFWQHINGNFIVALFIGIISSVASFARLITHLLEFYPVLVWSFFFGLIIASIYLVGKKIERWSVKEGIGIVIGTIIAFYITILPPMQNPDAIWFIFLSGAIAICAMILPGISGSFILLLLGSYETILGGIKDFKIATLIAFALGCLTGLLSFSKLLNWLFKRFHDLTIAILTGFLIGSLNKIWPWKTTVSTRVNSHGEIVPFIQENILPTHFDGNPQLTLAIIMLLLGLGLILILERLAVKR